MLGPEFLFNFRLRLKYTGKFESLGRFKALIQKKIKILLPTFSRYLEEDSDIIKIMYLRLFLIA